MMGWTAPLALCLVMLASASAGAQDTAVNSKVERRPTVGLRRSGTWVMGMAHHTIGCAVTKHRTAARSYLDAMTAADVAKAERAIFGTELSCSTYPGSSDFATDVRISPPEDIQRGMVAEALLSNDRNLAASLLPEPVKQQRYQRAWFDLTGRNPAVDEMAVCVAATDPQGILRVLDSTPETDGELRSIRNLPTLAPCLAAGATLDSNRQSIRAALAEALYHRVNDPAPALALQEMK